MKQRLPAFSTPPQSKRSYTVRAVVRAASILRAFKSMSDVLELRMIAHSTGLNKGTAFRLLETLVEIGMMDRVGTQGYRSRTQLIRTTRYRIGYASLSTLLPYTKVVADGLLSAASAADVDLLVLNNKSSARLAIENAERFIDEKVDLVIDSQLNFNVAAQIGAKFADAGIPFISVDIPHPGGTYFGADNYKAGRLGGRHLAKWMTKHWAEGAEQIVALGVDAAGPTLNSRLKGVINGLREFAPEVQGIPTVHYDTKGGHFDAALDIMRKHLRRRKAKRILLAAVNDTSALAALQAFREIGLENECAIVGHDAGIEARRELRRPTTRLIGSVALFPEEYGVRLVKLALDILQKRHVPPAVFTQHVLVTAQNVDKIYPNDSWMF
jgi:ribose transport system substrate-binding protein